MSHWIHLRVFNDRCDIYRLAILVPHYNNQISRFRRVSDGLFLIVGPGERVGAGKRDKADGEDNGKSTHDNRSLTPLVIRRSGVFVQYIDAAHGEALFLTSLSITSD